MINELRGLFFIVLLPALIVGCIKVRVIGTPTSTSQMPTPPVEATVELEPTIQAAVAGTLTAVAMAERALTQPADPATSKPANTQVAPSAHTPTPIPNGILIDDFEDDIDGWYAARAGTDGWQSHEAALNVFHSTDAAMGSGALQCDFNFNRTDEFDPRATCFLVGLPIQDWTEYSALQFQAKSMVDLSTNIRVFIALTTGEGSCWNELGDFQRLGSDYQTFTFNLDRVFYKTCENFEDYDQPLLGKDHVVRLHLIYTAERDPSGAVLVDDLWLIKSTDRQDG